MGFLAFLNKYWSIIAICIIAMVIFFYGWHLRGINDIAKQDSAIIAQTQKANEIATKYEQSVTKNNLENDKLNAKLKAIDEKPSYHCPVPIDGVRIINQAGN